MMDKIISETQQKPVRRKPLHWAVTAACAAVLMLCVLILPRTPAPEAEPDPAPAPAPLTQLAPGAASPNGMRKFMNYDGHRYEFMENGAVYDLSADALGEALGTIEYNLIADPKAYGKSDFAASFAVGGTVYPVKAYDPAFRIAVQHDGKYYLAESTDTLDDSPVEAAAYFETAGFFENTVRIAVCDHMERQELTALEGEKMTQMLTLLAQVQPAQLSNEQFRQIARAQNEGKSFRLKLQLNDGTEYGMYVIPSLSVAMFGDNRYTLTEDFSTQFGDVFAGLVQQPMPMH